MRTVSVWYLARFSKDGMGAWGGAGQSYPPSLTPIPKCRPTKNVVKNMEKLNYPIGYDSVGQRFEEKKDEKKD